MGKVPGMAPSLILGPLLRYAGASDATVWVETDAACEVEVLGHRARTFAVEGHHYALVLITDLEPGETYEYAVALDDAQVWPESDSSFPPPVIRTIAPESDLTLAFGSCRVAMPQEPPYTLTRDEDSNGYERDALRALALRMMREPRESWPDVLLMLGDQVYADEVSPGTREFIRSRRDPDEGPGETVADFEEYTRLYWESWKDPVVRWLLSTVPSAMIFDDHDVHDDWNTSGTWVRQMRSKWWWEERIVGAFVSYWIYQHLGNLSPRELDEDGLFNRVREADDATRILREFAYRADREVAGTRWSYHRDFGNVRLLMIDSRAGRVLEEGRRFMVDEEEWAWIVDKADGDFDHLLFGTSLPLLMAPGLHRLEAWNEAVCAGAWGNLAARAGEFLRQLIDLEHWSAFQKSFEALADLLRSVAAGERSGGDPPASIVVLSGDVHHGYLAEALFGEEAKSPVYQAVCSPMRNPLGRPERIAMRFGWSKLGERIGMALTRLAGVEEPSFRWHMKHEEPWFDNQVSTLRLEGRRATLECEKTSPDDPEDPQLHDVFHHRLA
ncbi:MAG TPA: alkaline phosphatase D family protein [Rubrobacteraceae bacterium]|nr:alkaline phosphatase D family protein [Rubrobacteraceae bacterium]